MTLYHVNEFALESGIPLPYDAAARSAVCIPPSRHLTLRRGSLAEVPSLLRKLRRQMVYDVGDGFLIAPEGLTLHIDLGGNVLTVDCPDEKLQAASAWVFHKGLGTATLMRGGLPLHGAGLEVAGRYITLMADSGTGKSTLSWFLLGHGARFGNDDLVPVYLEDDVVMAYPSVSGASKLQREAVDRYGLDPATQRVADYGTGEEEYYAAMPPDRRVLAPAPLAAVFLLRPFPLDDRKPLSIRRLAELVTIQRLDEAEAAQTLQFNLHTFKLLGKWLDERRITAHCRRLASRVPLYVLSYPKAYALLPEIGVAIRRTVQRHGEPASM